MGKFIIPLYIFICLTAISSSFSDRKQSESLTQGMALQSHSKTDNHRNRNKQTIFYKTDKVSNKNAKKTKNGSIHPSKNDVESLLNHGKTSNKHHLKKTNKTNLQNQIFTKVIKYSEIKHPAESGAAAIATKESTSKESTADGSTNEKLTTKDLPAEEPTITFRKREKVMPKTSKVSNTQPISKHASQSKFSSASSLSNSKNVQSKTHGKQKSVENWNQKSRNHHKKKPHKENSKQKQPKFSNKEDDAEIEHELLTELVHEREQKGSSHFPLLFLVSILLVVAAYAMYHNRQKIVAIVVEGRSPVGGHRASTYHYSKLEDAMPSVRKTAA